MAYLELEKIQFKPDSSTTTIDTAGYYLQWVYRTKDKNKDYYIFPAYNVENDSVSLIKDGPSKALYIVFADASRLLYNKHNKNVPEMATMPRTLARRPEEQ